MDRSNRNLWTWTVAQGLSRFGDHFQFLAVTAVAYAATHSAFYTALQMAVSHLPGLLWARWTGWLADRYSPRVVTLVLNLLRAFLTPAYIGRANVTTLLLLNFLASTIGAFAGPARTALLPGLVGRDRLLQANARQATIIGAVELLGPGIAGWALLRVGAGWAYGFNAVSFLIPVAAMLLVRPVVEGIADRPGPSPQGAAASFGGFLRGRPEFLAVLLANGAFLLGMWAVNAMFLPYTSDILHRDCPLASSVVPVERGGKKTVAVIQYELLAENPYRYTQEDVLVETFVRHKGIPADELAARGTELRQAFFARPQACLRASPLPKQFGWGLHFNDEGKVALCARESAEYRYFTQVGANGPTLLKAMRSSRA